MPDKNAPSDSGETPELEQRVDAMMDPKMPDPAGTNSGQPLAGAPELPEIDIFEGQTDAAKIVPESSEDQRPAEQSAKPVKTKKSVASKKSKAETAQSEAEPANSTDEAATDEAVEDIVAQESDDLLAAQDAEIGRAFVGKSSTLHDRLREFFAGWWDNKLARNSTLVVLVALLGTAMAIPTSRYAMLSTAGVRSSASVTILDDTTSLPLKNVSVTLGGSTAKTNASGLAHLQKLRLGKQKLTVKQLGFASVDKMVTVGLGSNPLGNFSLKAVGTQYTFMVSDYVSGKPVGSAEASSGDSNAQASDKGKIILTVGKIDSPSINVTLAAQGYRTESVTLDPATKAVTNVVMVTSRKEVFVSKQSGRYDVYKVDVDGKNKQILLAGTGLERPQISLVPHATASMVALVSSRDNKRNQDGYLLDTLTLINVDTGATLQLDQSEKIQIIDWVKDKLVYVKVKAGTSAGNPERYQLMSYDYGSTERLQLATANSFADIVSAKGVLYYATGNYYQPGQSQFVRINPDNTGKQVLLNDQVWNIIRSSYDNLYLAGTYSGNTQNWYSYHFGDSGAKQLSQAPGDANMSRYYVDAPDGKRALWTEVRDGKGTLLVYDSTTGKDTVLTAQSGLASPLRWLDSRTVIYHVTTPQETADYVISLDGGSPHKITDVTTVAGLGQWNYGY